MLHHLKLNNKNHFQRVQITILQRGQLFNLLFIKSNTNNGILFLSFIFRLLCKQSVRVYFYTAFAGEKLRKGISTSSVKPQPGEEMVSTEP